MEAAIAYALRRTSARLVLVSGVGALVYLVYRAMPHFHHWYFFRRPTLLVSSPSDLAVAALVAVVALVAAAALFRRPSISR